MFDNIEKKIKEIRTDDFYKPYIEELKSAYENDKDTPLLTLTYKDFMTFIKTGSRKESEKPYFHNRRRLGYLTMLALIYPDEEKYIDDLCEVVWAICSEVSWVIAPHLHCNLTEHKDLIDLFAAETGLYLAELVYLLGDRLPKNICDLIYSEVSYRIFDTMENTQSWWETLKSNWAAVCSGSVGMAYIYLAPERFEKVKPRIMKCMSNYLSGIGDDGCCTEGIDYWYYGFSFYLHFAEMLYRFCGEDIRHEEKVHKLVLYHQNMIMRKNTTVSFADGKREVYFIHIGLFNYLKNNYPEVKIPSIDFYTPETWKNLSGLGHSMTCQKPSWLIRDFLWSDVSLKPDSDFDGDNHVYYDKTQWYMNKKRTYSFAAKGGHNLEEHNHNDVGSFIIATDNGQMICDLGAMEYTRASLIPETKYNFFHYSSLGHNVPIVNGEEQGAGESFKAKNVCASEDMFKLDIEGAYEGDINRITRTFELKENSIVLTDEFDGVKSITERFVSVVKPEIVVSGVRIGDVLLKTDAQAKVDVRTISDHSQMPIDVYIVDFLVETTCFKAIFEVQEK